jgi:hypothetical protein
VAIASLVISSMAFCAVVLFGVISARLAGRAAVASGAPRWRPKARQWPPRALWRLRFGGQASEAAAKLAAQDARTRRIEALLDAFLEMRELFQLSAVWRARWRPGCPGPDRQK